MTKKNGSRNKQNDAVSPSSVSDGDDVNSDSGSVGPGSPTSINLSAIMSLSALAPQFKHVAVLADALSEAVQEEREVFDDMFSNEEIDDIILDAKEIMIISSRIGDDIFERLHGSVDDAVNAAEQKAADTEFESYSEGLNVIDENVLTPEQLEKMLNGELSVDDLTDEQKEELVVNNDNDLQLSEGSGEALPQDLSKMTDEEQQELAASIYETLEAEGFDISNFKVDYSDNGSDGADVLYDIIDIRANTFTTYRELVKNADKSVGRAWTEKGNGYVYNDSRWIRDRHSDF